MNRIKMFRMMLAVLATLMLHATAHAQYSQDVYKTRAAQDLYDERGFSQSGAISLDGSLMVNNQNGGVSYSYGISNFMSGGHSVQVALNLASAVQFTAFKNYNLANRNSGSSYDGWAKFHQNRPAWILSVGGWAVNVLSFAQHVHADPASPIYQTLTKEYDDRHLIWLCDGYDYSNRMRDFGPVGGQGESYQDVIRILRGDGSVLELLNMHTEADINFGDPDSVERLYTGHYFSNEANSHGYGIVEFDGTTITDAVSTHIGQVAPQYWFRDPLHPRKLRYFPGDGTEVIFREKVDPFGISAYTDDENMSGGAFAHPSIFYLDEIRGSGGTIVSFNRARHYQQLGGHFTGVQDGTRGRAPITSFTGHEIRLGDRSIVVEAFGRSTKIRFDSVMQSGTAIAGERMPYARLGGVTGDSWELANLDESDRRLYKSFLAQVTEIVDPLNRVTSFSYETVTKRYRNTGFPHSDGTVRLSLKNHRLKEVREPSARYVINYYGANDVTIDPPPITTDIKTLNNVVDSVRKYGPDGALLTTERYLFNTSDNLGPASNTEQITKDHVTGHESRTSFWYENRQLNNYLPFLTPGRFTSIYMTETKAGPVTTNTLTTFRSCADMPGWNCAGNFMTLPVSSVTKVNGVVRSYQEFYYELDTLRDFGGNAALAGKYGMEITRKITRTMKPDEPATVLLTDTTDYLHLPALDTTITWAETSWDKLKSLKQFRYLRDTLQLPWIMEKTWEEMAYKSPVAVFDTDTLTEAITAPPLFGLVERAWTTDSAGAVTGKRNVYVSDILEGDQRALRGKLVADSVLGSDGERLLAGTYDYRRELTGTLPTGSRNALGVPTFLSYGYSFCDGVPFWEECTDNAPIGTVLANDGTTWVDTLTWSHFPLWFAKPSAERQIVRRYNAFGQIQRDTLTTYNERTWHGLTSAAVDANGWLSRYDYDYNGRLTTGWLPGDFAGEGILDTFIYDGPESIDLYGVTDHHRRADIMHCYDGYSILDSGSVLRTTHQDTLFASLPVTYEPPCPCVAEEMPLPPSRNEKDDDRQLLETCEQDLGFNQYAGYGGYIGVLSMPLTEKHPLKTALSIDHATLDLMVTSIHGECVHLEVAIDSVFSETFIFNCEDDEEPGGEDPPHGLPNGSITSVAGGYKLSVDLSSVAAQLGSRPAGTLVNIELRTPTVGATVAFVNGSNAEDLRPRLTVDGEFKKVWDRADYTIAFEHDDNWLRTTERAKIDDARHTSNDLTSQGIAIRRDSSLSIFGAQYRHLASVRTVDEGGVIRRDTSSTIYTGLGLARRSFDAEGDSISMFHDPLTRPVLTINTDGTQTFMQYMQGKPDSLGITDQEFLGYCDAVISIDETGTKFARFTDALGRLRREVADYGDTLTHLNLTTRYEYDLFGRLLEVTNPKGQITSYTYDEFGRVKTKSQPDLGTVSYVYDNLGNVRFTQDEKQAEKNLVTFRNYDDLNRVTLIGEAYVDETEQCPLYNEETGIGGCNNGTRLTDLLDGNVMHVQGGSILTANRSMFLSPVFGTNTFPAVEGYQLRYCELEPESRLNETERSPVPTIMHGAVNFAPRGGGIGGALMSECEDISWHPEFARIAINYDRLPPSQGAVWYGFPSRAQWDKLAPTGRVRNLKGREAAVAYREKGHEAFHYAVMSYDERGRVEALIRYNENLGFDAVYYQYNSAEDVIAVTVADPWRRFTSWYGYDGNGRLDSVWTSAESVGTGLLTGGDFYDIRYPGPASRPAQPEIVYSYTRLDRVKELRYPEINALVEYAYNPRKVLDSMIALKNGAHIFTQRLEYDPAGEITAQEYQHGTGARERQEYAYDSLNRLIAWQFDGRAEYYQYDEVGNRQQTVHSAGTPVDYGYHTGKNRLWYTDRRDMLGNDTTHGYGYNPNGARTSHLLSYNTPFQSRLLKEEYFDYSFRGLMTRAKVRSLTPLGVMGRWQDWRYRYSAGGEREQKKLYPTQDGVVPAPDSTILPWCYYLLGGGRQLAVYHGQQYDSLQTECGDFGQTRVYFYPFEYLTYGGGDVALITTRPDGRREYRINDHLGSSRAVLDDAGVVASTVDYAPFGSTVAVTGADVRKKFIDKEFDGESGTYNTGVRQYEPETGFTSIDPLWESFRAYSPYHYSYLNPVAYKDPSGMGGDSALDRWEDEPVDGGGGGGKVTDTEGPHDSMMGPSLNMPVGWTSSGGRGSSPGPSNGHAGMSPAQGTGRASGATGARGTAKGTSLNPVETNLSRSKNPDATKHIEDAQASGHPKELTLERTGAPQRRTESLRGHKTQKGMDRDEYPPACTKQGGTGASVRHIPSSDNRSAGASLGGQLRGYPDGTVFIINIVD